jgi:hypothetical protein
VAARRRFQATEPGRRRRLRGLGASAAALLAGIHLDRLGHVAREATYLGLLFSVAAVGFGWVAAHLLRSDDIDGWLMGAALAVGATAGYLLSCTVGLPGLSREHWSVLGNTSTLLGAVLLAATGARTRLHAEGNMP